MTLAPILTASRDDLRALRHDAQLIPHPDAVFRIEGTGAVSCLQGLLTNDVTSLSPGQAAWGALLTPKGMIITTAWVLHGGDAIWATVPESARASTQQLFTRTLPPRLARVADRTDSVACAWLANAAAPPGPGWFTPRESAPCTAMVLHPRATPLADVATENHWAFADAGRADLLKLLLGWPTLGREIDDRTLPQEVRFDELGGVRYDKGCYTGQETVARLHFRGHANRRICGVTWEGAESLDSNELTRDGKAVGSIRTLAQLEHQLLALAMLRREVEVGSAILAGARTGTVVTLPFDLAASGLG